MKSSLVSWRTYLITIFLLVAWLWGNPGQVSAQLVADTVRVMGEDSLTQTPVVHIKEKVHSPHKATFYSAILPGLGQAYNKKYWKIPILYAGIGAVGYAIHFNSTNYQKYRNAYRDFLIHDPGNQSYLDIIPSSLSVEDIEGQYSDWF